jgi:flagellar hook-associated protein 1 FlgK
VSINQLYHIGRSALTGAQYGLEVTGNNIANVNTPNYSRQRVTFGPGVAVSIGGIPFGTGVSIEGVERIYDPFLGYQTNLAYGAAEDYSLREQIYTRIESQLYPSDESNLGTLMDGFFNAWQDLSVNPSGAAERNVVLAKGEELTATIRSLNQSLESEVAYANTLMEGYRDEVNRLSEEIARLNNEILRTSGANSSANDLLDQRDALVRELSGHLNVTVFEEQSGTITVLAAGGQALVQDDNAYSLDLFQDSAESEFYHLSVLGKDITEQIQGGKINGLLEAQDHLVQFQEDLDRLAASLVNELNQIHAAGYDLGGVTGRDFFEPLQVSANPFSVNAGGTGFTFQEIADPSALTLDDYEIRFTAADTFDIVNVSEGTTVASGLTYTSGSNIDFEGIRVVLSDVDGGPAAGDRFRISVTDGMAGQIRVALDDPNHIAAAEDPDALPGDNRNALALADLRNAKVLDDGTTSLGGFYQTIASDVGLLVMDASRMADAKDVLYESMESYRQSVSGVSLEEEELKLLLFQNAYQAAARFLQVVEDMMDNLFEL